MKPCMHAVGRLATGLVVATWALAYDEMVAEVLAQGVEDGDLSGQVRAARMYKPGDTMSKPLFSRHLCVIVRLATALRDRVGIEGVAHVQGRAAIDTVALERGGGDRSCAAGVSAFVHHIVSHDAIGSICFDHLPDCIWRPQRTGPPLPFRQGVDGALPRAK